MPYRYPAYPYVEPEACGFSDREIETVVADLLSQNPRVSLKDGGPLDILARALNVDIEYSGIPNEILLDVPLERKAVIWLGRNGKPRHDRMTVAKAIGHWILHVPAAKERHPDCGIQALYEPTDTDAQAEAERFAHALLMPAETFKQLWYEGKAQYTSDTLNVRTQAVYDRAKTLMLSGGTYSSHN